MVEYGCYIIYSRDVAIAGPRDRKAWAAAWVHLSLLGRSQTVDGENEAMTSSPTVLGRFIDTFLPHHASARHFRCAYFPKNC